MTKSNVVPLKLVKTKKRTNKARVYLEEACKDLVDYEDFPLQGFVLVGWCDGGNRFRVNYFTRKDFPTLFLPEFAKQAIADNITREYKD